MREIIIQNKKIQKLLEERSPLVAEGQALQLELEELKKAFQEKMELQNKAAKKINKIKDKLVPLLNKEMQGKLDEFEDTREAEIKGDDIIVTIGNHLEEFKVRFYEQKNKAKKANK